MKRGNMGSSGSMKKMKVEEEEGNEDRISGLRESLLHHIFSFLDMKQAVQTSYLSRKWRYFWKSLPTLNFDSKIRFNVGSLEKNHMAFMNFIDLVFILRDHSSIGKFLVRNSCDGIEGRLNAWLVAAVIRNVREVSVSIPFQCSARFHPSVFTSKSLTKLEFTNTNHAVIPKKKIKLPDSIDLPSLKYLHLESFEFCNEYLTNHLLLNCPVLESLIILRSEFFRVNLNISSVTLKHFRLGNCRMNGLEFDCADVKVKLDAPNLLTFDYHVWTPNDYCLENLSSLVNANISVHEDPLSIFPSVRGIKYAQHAVKTLKELHNVEHLTLSAVFIKDLSGALDLSCSLATQLSNLRRLELSIFISIDCFRAVGYLLHVSSNIDSLSLTTVQTHHADQAMEKIWDEILSGSLDISNCLTTQICNLRCLKLKVWLSTDCIHAIFFLLHVSSTVESLFLRLTKGYSIKRQAYPTWDEVAFNSGSTLWYWEGRVPLQFMHLKFVELRDVHGCINELKFLEILLKVAAVLENVTIGFISDDVCYEKSQLKKEEPEKYWQRKEQEAEFRKNLLKLPRASSCSTILFLEDESNPC